MSADPEPSATEVTAKPAKRSPGEEPGRAELRRAAFLAAAREVFLENGYEGASMSEIVRRAGGSMSTLYEQFGDKKGLFQAVVDRRVAEITRQSELELEGHTPLREGLERIGRYYVQQLTSPESLNMVRAMISQARNFPEMAMKISYRIPERVRESLGHYLRDRVAAGEIEIDDCEGAAAAFLDLLRARMQLRGLVDVDWRPSEEEVKTIVDRAVKVCLGGISAL
ncbi:MAG: TetR/AcrR family transcriptional regulator [Hyphomonadaceae bacterium]